MTTTSKASSGQSQAVISLVRVSTACAKASGDPRVPILSGEEGGTLFIMLLYCGKLQLSREGSLTYRRSLGIECP